MNDNTRANLKTDLEYWIDFEENHELFLKNLKKAVEKLSDNVIVPTYLEDLENELKTAKRYSTLILNSFDSINFLDETLASECKNLNSFVSLFKKNLSARNKSSANLTAIDYHLGKVILRLQNIEAKIVLKSVNLNYIYELDGDTEAELQMYSSRGVIIHSDEGYDESPIGQLEKMILGKGEAIRKYFGEDYIISENDRFKKLFYALVAPSLEGKTQTAFTFKTLRPLYFVLIGSSLERDEKIQVIYKNFLPLSKKLQEYAEIDLALVKKSNENPDVQLSTYSQVSATDLTDKHLNTKFLCLGFIVALINQANAEFAGSKLRWMEFFAKSPRNFSFYPMSLNDVENFDFGPYVLFLDEFQGSDWTAFVRNIFRAALVPVLVANTNTNAANLVGKEQFIYSRTAGETSWSFVAVRLNSINKNILAKMYPDFTNVTTAIVRMIEDRNEQTLAYDFFEDFEHVQLQHLRPGLVGLVVSHLKVVSTDKKSKPSVNSFLAKIVDFIARNLENKKKTMNSTDDGILGSLALFLKNAYNSSDDSTKKELDSAKKNFFHNKSYLQDHFYYLINPADRTNWCFLTYPPRVDRPGQTIAIGKSLRYVGKGLTRPRLIDWEIEYTYFNEKEVFAFLACLATLPNISIVSVLRAGLLRSRASPASTGDSENTSQGISLKGNELEVIATVAIIEASHHSIESLDFDFSGQDGESFLTNLVENFVNEEGFRCTKRIKLNFKIIKKILKVVHIPFLFPDGLELPEFFKKHFTSPSGFHRRTVNFGEYGRTQDSTEIDRVFNFYIKNENRRAPPSLGICSVECKNWKRNILAKDLVPILEKSAFHSASMSLIICNSLGNSTGLKALIDHCEKEKVLVVKLVEKEISGNIKEFDFVEHCQSPSVNAINRICIVLELKVINSGGPEDYEEDDKEAEKVVKTSKKFKLQ